jgi:hypothetical protein
MPGSLVSFLPPDRRIARRGFVARVGASRWPRLHRGVIDPTGSRSVDHGRSPRSRRRAQLRDRDRRPRKSSHTASALDVQSHQLADRLRIEASPAEYRRMLSWAKWFGGRRWAVEDAEGLGPAPRAVVGRAGRGHGRCPGHRDRPGAGAVPGRAAEERHARCRGGTSVARCTADTRPVVVEGGVDGAEDARRTPDLPDPAARAQRQRAARLLRELLFGSAHQLTADRAAATLARVRRARPGTSPQGGGELVTGHRPREAVMLAVRTLARLPYTLPPQDLSYDLSASPPAPAAGSFSNRPARPHPARRHDSPAGQRLKGLA